MNGSFDGAGVAQAKAQVEETLFLGAFFCGEDDHRASLRCLLHPHPTLPGDAGPARTLVQKKSLPAAPLLSREETHAKEAPMFLQLM